MNGKEIFNTTIAIAGGFLTYVFGGWDTCIMVLVGFIAVDYATGVISGIIQQKLNSHTGFRGLLRKCTILLVLIIAVLLDRLLNNSMWVFRTLTCYFYIANEGISIFENAGKCGIPLPKKLINTLEQLNKRGE
jgi:toxin secretion/phage lysis holin